MTATPADPTAAVHPEAVAPLVALANLAETLDAGQRATLAAVLYEMAEYCDPDPDAGLAGRWAGSPRVPAGRVPR